MDNFNSSENINASVFFLFYGFVYDFFKNGVFGVPKYINGSTNIVYSICLNNFLMLLNKLF